MKKRWLALSLCALLLIGIGCAVGTATVLQEPDGGVYDLYFLERDLTAAEGEDALRAEERALEDEGLTPTETARLLTEALLKGPEDPTLKNPIPRGTELVSVTRIGTEVRVDLSSDYGTLSGVELSLADYAITLTLTQLPDIARVRITVQGRELDYRSRQTFLSRDVLLAPKEDVVGAVEVCLWFLNEESALTAEKRTLSLYEGDTQVSAVVRALENGPEDRSLSAVLPEGFKVRKLWTEEGLCYVSLSSALLEGEPEAETLELAVSALERSLLSLESVEQVRFLVDGELAETYGPVSLAADRRENFKTVANATESDA